MALGLDLENPDIKQQGDVLLAQTLDNGEIEVFSGVVVMSGGLDTAAYLSLFGGNFDDSGDEGDARSWWGNHGEDDAQHIRSRTQYLLGTIPANTANLRRIEDAAKSDLGWLVDEGAADSIDVLVTMPGLNKIKITVTINGNESLEFSANWSVEL